MPVDLDRYISNGTPDLSLDATRDMLKKDKLFVFTGVLKAQEITVEATKESGESLKVDVPTVKEIVGGNVDVAAENESSTKIRYQGKVPAGFGFKAVQLDMDDGKIKMKPMKSDMMAAAAGAANVEPDNDYKVMIFEQEYISLP